MLQVAANAVIGREAPAFDYARIDQHPRSVAQRGDGLAAFKEAAHEALHIGIGSQLVAVDRAPGQQQRVVAAGIGLARQPVDGDGIRLLELAISLCCAALRRNHLDLCASIEESLARFKQFRMFEAVGRN
jgi:hypothetical protein